MEKTDCKSSKKCSLVSLIVPDGCDRGDGDIAHVDDMEIAPSFRTLGL